MAAVEFERNLNAAHSPFEAVPTGVCMSAFNATRDTKKGTADAPANCRGVWKAAALRMPIREQTMKIGIIGAGHIGGTLTRRLRSLGHEVRVANSRGPESLQDLAKETGAQALEVRDAPKGADLVIVTIPEKNIPNLPKDLFRPFNPEPQQHLQAAAKKTSLGVL
jgi:phosphoglycerate dehydrogenase-like enzyme